MLQLVLHYTCRHALHSKQLPSSTRRPSTPSIFWRRVSAPVALELNGTLSPKPEIPNPKPQTPNPKPQSPNPQVTPLKLPLSGTISWSVFQVRVRVRVRMRVRVRVRVRVRMRVRVRVRVRMRCVLRVRVFPPIQSTHRSFRAAHQD